MTMITHAPKKIGSIAFALLSPVEIREMSATKIITADTYDDDGYPIEMGLMDPRLGVIEPGLVEPRRHGQQSSGRLAGLVDQQHRDVVADGIGVAAPLADELVGAVDDVGHEHRLRRADQQWHREQEKKPRGSPVRTEDFSCRLAVFERAHFLDPAANALRGRCPTSRPRASRPGCGGRPAPACAGLL